MRHARVVAVLFAPASWAGNAACLRHVTLVSCGVPVGGPLPHVTDHVVNAISVWREPIHRRRALIAIFCPIFAREFALPGIGHVLSARRELVSPSIFCVFEPAPGSKFPFRLRRQCLARPSRVGERIRIGDMHHGMIVETEDVTLWTVGVAPVRPFEERPPFAPTMQVNQPCRRGEHQRAGIDHASLRTRIMLWVRRNLSGRDMACRLHEFLELSICDWMAIHPERVDDYDVSRSFLPVMPVRAHGECAAGYPDHIWRLHIYEVLAGLEGPSCSLLCTQAGSPSTGCSGLQHSAATTILLTNSFQFSEKYSDPSIAPMSDSSTAKRTGIAPESRMRHCAVSSAIRVIFHCHCAHSRRRRSGFGGKSGHL